MSLIEEALRKQQQETAGPPPAGGNTAPPSAPPVPPPATEAAPRGPGRKPWLLLAVLGALFLVLAGVVVWSFYAGLFILRRPAESAARPAAAPAAATTAAAVTASVTTHAAVAVSTGTVTETVGSVETYMDTPPEQKIASTAAPPTIAAPTVTASTAVTAAPPAPSPSVKELVLWPHLVVSGLMGDSRGVRGTAIINGQLVNVGETIEGAQVVAVTRAGVTLSYGGETRTLKIGDSTE